MKIGFTCGAFDVLHAGHILMFQECKKVCDYLIVGLQTDPSIDRENKNKPVQSLLERQIQLNSNKYINEVVLYETEKDLENLLYTLPISIRILDRFYATKSFTGKDICAQKGIEIYYNDRFHDYSTTYLRKRILDAAK